MIIEPFNFVIVYLFGKPFEEDPPATHLVRRMIDDWQRARRWHTFGQAAHIPAPLNAFQFRRTLHAESVVACELHGFAVLHLVEGVQRLRFCFARVLRLRDDGIGAVFGRCNRARNHLQWVNETFNMVSDNDNVSLTHQGSNSCFFVYFRLFLPIFLS